ncbi:MAG TPA: DUF2254 domain-containing protein [Terriglobales bacterium]|jgi:uncharacterized membrane protein|nr:DUF2254 domain-containing protein [Terriglobales bacterium]
MSWAFRRRLRSFLRSSLWVVPAIATVTAFLSVPLLRILDRRLGFQLFRFSPEGARAAAGIVSAAMLSFVVLFFSVLLLTVQIASSTLSPRIIARPFRSRALKASLGLFVFTLIYSMAVVARGVEGNIGQLPTAIVMVLTIISICVFLYVVEHVSKELRPATVMAAVAAEGVEVIKAVYPKMIAQDSLDNLDEGFLGTPSRTILLDGRTGVVEAVDIEKLVDLAIRTSCTIEVVPQVGDSVASNDPVFRLYGNGVAVNSKELLGHIVLEQERTLDQDPAFAFRIIVDIASKALSPAINDPTTAVLALDQIHKLLREVGRRRLDTGLVLDWTGHPRLIYRTPNWEDFVGLAVTEIRQFGANSTQVVRRMRAMLENLIPLLPPDRSSVLLQELGLLKSTVDQGFVMLQDRMRADLPDSQGLGGHRKTA